MLRVFAILVLCCMCTCVFGDQPKQCSTSTVKISVKTQQNQTGQWVTQVGLIQDTPANKNGNKSEPWNINVEQRSTVCQNEEQSLETILILTAPSTLTLNGPKGVPQGYELFKGVGYYKFHSQAATWPQALQACADEGGHLVIINSEKEADVMKAMFGRYPTILAASNNDWAWIGLQRIGENYFTIFGDALETTGFQRWNKGEPHKGTQFCGLVNRADGSLADHLCDWKVAFVCEFDADE